MSYIETDQLSAAFKAHLREHSHIEHYKKGQIILSPGYFVKAWYIQKGIAKIFYYTDEGKQVIAFILSEQEILTSVESFFGHQRNPYYIEILEDSILYALSKEEFEACGASFPEAHYLAMQILLAYKSKSDQRASLLSLPAKERYQQFNQQFKTARLSVTDLSSFLHLAPTYLSLIRKQK